MILNHSGPYVTNAASGGLPFFGPSLVATCLHFYARRSAELAAGRARNQSSDLVQVALMDRRVEPEHSTPSTQPVRVPEGPPSAELPKREAMTGVGVFVSQ